jgi:hypothetical protein
MYRPNIPPSISFSMRRVRTRRPQLSGSKKFFALSVVDAIVRPQLFSVRSEKIPAIAHDN